VRESRSHSDFVEVESYGPLEVQVRNAPSFSVVVRIDSNLLADVETRVVDEALVIEAHGDIHDFVDGPHVRVEMPSLAAATVIGSGSLDARHFDEDHTLRLGVNGSGDLAFAGSSPRMIATVDGSGEMQIDGSTDFADLGVWGSGDIEAKALTAGAGHISVHGSGSVNATINGEVSAVVDGGGTVGLYGEVALERSVVRGGGEILMRGATDSSGADTAN
jgi:uncharacterized protein YaiE (UPF0345 family)